VGHTILGLTNTKRTRHRPTCWVTNIPTLNIPTAAITAKCLAASRCGSK